MLKLANKVGLENIIFAIVMGAIISICAVFAQGCGAKKRYYSSGVAPVGTITIIFAGEPTPDEQEEIEDAAAQINHFFSTEVTNNYDIDVVVKGNGDLDVVFIDTDSTVYVEQGEQNETPNLYEKLCKAKGKHHGEGEHHCRRRGHEISCAIARGRGGHCDSPELH